MLTDLAVLPGAVHLDGEVRDGLASMTQRGRCCGCTPVVVGHDGLDSDGCVQRSARAPIKERSGSRAVFVGQHLDTREAAVVIND
jgi:hypothetical protein